MGHNWLAVKIQYSSPPPWWRSPNNSAGRLSDGKSALSNTSCVQSVRVAFGGEISSCCFPALPWHPNAWLARFRPQSVGQWCVEKGAVRRDTSMSSHTCTPCTILSPHTLAAHIGFVSNQLSPHISPVRSPPQVHPLPTHHRHHPHCTLHKFPHPC